MSTDTPSIGSTIPLRVHHQAPRVVASPSLRKLTTGPLYRLPGLKSALPTWAAPGIFGRGFGGGRGGSGLGGGFGGGGFSAGRLCGGCGAHMAILRVFSTGSAVSGRIRCGGRSALGRAALRDRRRRGGLPLQPAAASASSRARTAANARRQGFLIDIHIPFANGFIWRTGQFFRLYQRSI